MALSAQGTDDAVRSALAAGAAGFLHKDSGLAARLGPILDAVLTGPGGPPGAGG